MPTLVKILADLNEQQKQVVDSWYQPHHDFSDHVFGEDGKRVTFPLNERNSKEINETKEAVTNHLEHHGHEISDYTKGLAKDKHGREVRIGSLLEKTKAPNLLKKGFEADPERAGSKAGGDSKNGLNITVSRDPHDVAAMSTGQGWTSCMNMEGGCNRHYLPHEVMEGTHVAYLHKGHDPELKHPLARILLKPYSSGDGHTVIRPESQYGSASGSFMDHLTNWSKKHFPLKEGETYTKHHGIYDDTGTREIDTDSEEPYEEKKKYKPGEHYGEDKNDSSYTPKEIKAVHNHLASNTPEEVFSETRGMGRHKDVDDAILKAIHEGRIDPNNDHAHDFLSQLINMNHPDHSAALGDIVPKKDLSEKHSKGPYSSLISQYLHAGRNEDAKSLIKRHPELAKKLKTNQLPEVGNYGIDHLLNTATHDEADDKSIRRGHYEALQSAARMGHEGHRQRILDLIDQDKKYVGHDRRAYALGEIKQEAAKHGGDELKRKLIDEGLKDKNKDLVVRALDGASPKLRMETLNHVKSDFLKYATPTSKEVSHFIDNRHFDPSSEYHVDTGRNYHLKELTKNMSEKDAKRLLDNIGQNWSANYFSDFKAKDPELARDLAKKAADNKEEQTSGSSYTRGDLIRNGLDHPETGREVANHILQNAIEGKSKYESRMGRGGISYEYLPLAFDKHPDIAKDVLKHPELRSTYMKELSKTNPRAVADLIRATPDGIDKDNLSKAIGPAHSEDAKQYKDQEALTEQLYRAAKAGGHHDLMQRLLREGDTRPLAHTMFANDWDHHPHETRLEAAEEAPTLEHLDRYESKNEEKPDEYYDWQDSDDEDDNHKAEEHDERQEEIEDAIRERREQLEEEERNREWDEGNEEDW